MLVNMKEMLEDAEKNNYAVGSFNTPNFETLKAVIHAAEDMNSPVIIDHAQGHEPLVKMETIAPLMLEYAKKAKVPVCVHIDHASDFNFAMRAVRCGFTSIMYDCSAKPFEENVKAVKDFVAMVHPLGITVEAEVGDMPNNMPTKVPGQEKSDLSDLSKYFTKPDEAAKFCELTHCDALAISVGTVHGMYESKPVLDLKRIQEIRSKTPKETKLVLHGGSGTGEKQIRAAISSGIRKINYFTAMDTAPAAELSKMIQDANGLINYSVLADKAENVLYEKCKEAIGYFLNR